MADKVGIKWLYPPNFEGTFPPGTPTGNRRYSVLLTGFSDGTGEENVTKVRRSDLLTSYGKVPSSLVIEKITYEIAGMCATLSWSSTTDDQILLMNAGSQEFDFTKTGGLYINDTNPTDDPEWGSIVLDTTSGASDFSDPEEITQPSYGDSYNIQITFRAKE